MAQLMVDLPNEIKDRLKLQRVAVRHGTDTRMFLYHIWDSAQPSILSYNKFSYGVVYDPGCRYHTWKRARGGPCNLMVRFILYRAVLRENTATTVNAVWQEMNQAERVLYNFMKYENDQLIGLFRFFDAESVEELQSAIYQSFLELIPYWHPKYASIVDNYGAGRTRDQMADAISGRKKFQPTGPRKYLPAPEYCRHVPIRLRLAVFDRDGYRCLYPSCNSASNKLHADHILPVSLGGITVMDNLQTLCDVHNLTKGNRESVDYRRKAERVELSPS